MEKWWRNKGINIATTNKTSSPQEHLTRPVRHYQRIPLDHSFPMVYILWGFGPSSETQSSEYWLQVADYRIRKCGNGIGNSQIYWIMTMNIGNGFGLCNTQSQRNRIGNVEWGKGNIMKMNVDTMKVDWNWQAPQSYKLTPDWEAARGTQLSHPQWGSIGQELGLGLSQ